MLLQYLYNILILSLTYLPTIPFKIHLNYYKQLLPLVKDTNTFSLNHCCLFPYSSLAPFQSTEYLVVV